VLGYGSHWLPNLAQVVTPTPVFLPKVGKGPHSVGPHSGMSCLTPDFLSLWQTPIHDFLRGMKASATSVYGNTDTVMCPVMVEATRWPGQALNTFPSQHESSSAQLRPSATTFWEEKVQTHTVLTGGAPVASKASIGPFPGLAVPWQE
jgi:hypothetical protein